MRRALETERGRYRASALPSKGTSEASGPDMDEPYACAISELRLQLQSYWSGAKIRR
jgi:hypothetical protein